MAEIDEAEVSVGESICTEANVPKSVGSDDVEITMDETTEKEVEVTEPDKLDEMDGILISLTEGEDDVRISSDGVNISHNVHVKQRVALFEKLVIASPPEVGYDTSTWDDVNLTGKRNQGYIKATHAAVYVSFKSRF